MTLVARLYELWLLGTSIDQIIESNKAIPKGAILKARVEGLWDERREAYISELQSNAQDRVKLTALESANFMGLLLGVANKQHGEALRKYLLSGNKDDLGGFEITSIKQYKEAVEMFAKITGQDKPKAVSPAGGGTLSVNVAPGPGGGGSVGNVSVRWTPEQGDAIRAVLEAKDLAGDPGGDE